MEFWIISVFYRIDTQIKRGIFGYVRNEALYTLQDESTLIAEDNKNTFVPYRYATRQDAEKIVDKIKEKLLHYDVIEIRLIQYRPDEIKTITFQ